MDTNTSLDRKVVGSILLAAKRLEHVRRKMVRGSGVTVEELDILGCLNTKTYTSFSRVYEDLMLPPSLFSRRMRKLRRVGLVLVLVGGSGRQHFNSKSALLTVKGEAVYLSAMEYFHALTAKLMADMTTDEEKVSIRVSRYVASEISSYLKPSAKDIEEQYVSS